MMERYVSSIVKEQASGTNRVRSVQVRVPASTSNLGPGFDCFGLALRLHLYVRATVVPGSAVECRVRSRGATDGAFLSRASDNLIYQAMQFAAARESLQLPPVRLAVHNEIPLGRGLGSSAAAIIAGIKLCGEVCGHEISNDDVMRYATEMEGHADNVAPSIYGGFAVTCVEEGGRVLAVKKHWPSELKIVVISPHVPLETKRARSALPPFISWADAIYNIQRAALFCAAIEARAYDLLWEAMKDRLHQELRQSMFPGLAEALATPRLDGLVGLALSGAGPSIFAIARYNFEAIGDTIARNFLQHGIGATSRVLEVDDDGLQLWSLGSFGKA